MDKRLVGFLLTLLAGTITLSGESFWKEKEFTEWTQKEVIRMMTKSPWARSLIIPLPAGGVIAGLGGGGDYLGSVEDPFPENKMPSRGGIPGVPNLSRMARRPQVMGPEDGSTSIITPDWGRRSAEGRVLLELTVRWYALPLRHARARWAELWPPEKKDRKNNGRISAYIIGVSGFPPHWFSTDAEHLKVVFEKMMSESFLKIRDLEPIAAGGLWIPPKQDVVNLQLGPWHSGAEFYLLFPRGEEGSHVITLEDKKVEFVSKIGSLEVKRKFKLKNMVYNGELEL
jgi:hypothetical protein